MPELLHPPEVRDVDLEAAPLDLERRLLEEAHAVNLVKKTFLAYQTERDSAHTSRWDTLESLYYGRVPRRYWPGSKKPRASLGIPLVFEQEESLLPALESAIFQQYPYWFGVQGVDGISTPEEAQQVAARLMYWFETPRDFSGRTVSDTLALCLQQGLHLGNYVAEIGWDEGGFFCEHRDVREIFIDPKLKSPYLDDASCIIRQTTMSIRTLKTLTNVSLPPDGVLNFLAKNRERTSADMIRACVEAYRGMSSNPDALDPDPAKQDIDVLLYWTNKRLVWVLGSAVLLVNQENDYGFKPFIGGPFLPEPSMASWWSAAVGDFVEGEQRLQQGLTNRRLDELALANDPPRYRKRGAFTHPAVAQWRPGLEEQIDRPSEDIQVFFPKGLTSQNMVEVSMSEARAARRMGVNDISLGGGAARPANTRTAAGVALQNAGASNRLYLPVRRVERFLIGPLLVKAATLLAKYDKDATVGLFADGQNGQRAVRVSPEALKKRVRFVLSGAAKMLSRDKQRAALPIILQSYLAGPFVQAVAASGLTPNTEQIDRFIMEATETRGSYAFLRKMTPEEQQARNQPPAEAVMRQQTAQESNQARMMMAQQKIAAAQDLQAEKSALELLRLLLEDKGLDKQLRAEAIKVVAQLEAAQARGKGGKDGDSV